MLAHMLRKLAEEYEQCMLAASTSSKESPEAGSDTSSVPGRVHRAAENAGLAGLTPHELRDTCASLAVSAGANVKAVQRMLGHASAAMTLDVYAGLLDDNLDDVTARLNALPEHPLAM